MNNLFKNQKLYAFVFILSFLFIAIVSTETKQVIGKREGTESLAINSVGSSPNDSDLTPNNVDITELSYWDDNYGTINDIYVAEDRLYISLGTEGFIVYDITDFNPQLIATWNLYTCERIYAENDYVFVSNNTGFNIVDISNLATPNWICGWSGASGGVTDLAAHGNFVYLADNNEFILVNITDKNNPVDIWSPTHELYELVYTNGYIFSANDVGCVDCYNVTDPFAPDYIDAVGSGAIKFISYSNNYIYYSTAFGAGVANATVKNDLTQLSTILYNDTTYDIGVRNNHLFACEGDKLEVYDWTDKTNPVYKYTYTNQQFMIYNIFIYDHYAFVYSDYAIEVLDISNPVDITSVYFEIYDGFTEKILLTEDYAYVADTNSLKILDITDQAHPSKVGYYYDFDGGEIFDLFIRNDYLYLLEYDAPYSLIVILNIEDPINPVYQGNITFNYLSYGFFVTDEYAYVAQGTEGVAIIDIYYPDYPQKSLQYDEHGSVWGLSMYDGNLILAAEDYMHVIDVSNPYKPEQIGNYTRPSANYQSVKVFDTYAYFLVDEGFDIINLEDITEPVKIGQFFTYSTPYYVTMDGRYVYMLDTNGLNIFDAENTAHPRLLGSYNDLTHMVSLAINNGYIYVAEGSSGTRILETNPLLTVKSPLNLASFVGGFVLFSIIGLIMSKKRKK